MPACGEDSCESKRKDINGLDDGPIYSKFKWASLLFIRLGLLAIFSFSVGWSVII